LAVSSTIGLILAIAATNLGVVLAPWLWATALAGILLHVMAGWKSSGVGVRGLVDLLWAPVYILWKLTLRFSDRGKTPEEWVRTKREAHP
jgi:hypothetical protein